MDAQHQEIIVYQSFQHSNIEFDNNDIQDDEDGERDVIVEEINDSQMTEE